MSNHTHALSRTASAETTRERPPDRSTDIAPARMLLGFLDRNLGRFSPAMQNTIGFSVMLLLFVVTLHASVAPTFVSGKLFAQASENDDREFARSYMLEYNDATSVVTEFGSWMLPLRFGVPRRIRLRVLDVNSRLVDEVTLFGPWPILNALYPMEYQITVHAYKPQGQRIEVVERRSPVDAVAEVLTRAGIVTAAYAQTLGPQPRVSAHLQDIGSIGCATGSWCGTKGENRRLEGFSIRLSPSVPNLTVKYLCRVQATGDSKWMDEGQFCGTQGQGRPLEGFSIRLEGAQAQSYDIMYQAHVQNIGDTTVGRNGSFVGAQGQSLRVEAIKVWIAPRR